MFSVIVLGIGLSDADSLGARMRGEGRTSDNHGDGDAYVRAVQKFDSYTLHVMLNCPDRWRKYLVTPIVNDTRRVADDAVKANSCYVRMDGKSSLEDVIAAYDVRISFLEYAMHAFGQFECDLDRMMRQVDLFTSERKTVGASRSARNAFDSPVMGMLGTFAKSIRGGRRRSVGSWRSSRRWCVLVICLLAMPCCRHRA